MSKKQSGSRDADEGEDRCRVATNAAMKVALDECSEEALLANLSSMMGLEDTPDVDGLPDDLDRPDCMDMAVVRGWVVVRAKELMAGEMGAADAISQAWDEATEDCGW